MRKLRAVRTAAVRLGLSLLGASLAIGATAANAAWDKPWQSTDRALVIDAYEFNPIDWKELVTDQRVVGFINKASDGLPPEWNCHGKTGDDELICKNRWWKYSVTKELYMTRRAMAKELGLKWGAYHLARPGNPREQADHFIDFAEPEADELIAIDIEDNTAEWMSLADAETFANQIFIRTGRYPVLYTNGSTAKWISDYKEKYKLLSRLPLWYARYRDDITGKFPEETWPSYALWQFSSMHNCSTKKCPYRIKGAKTDIDVNVSPLDVAGLRAAWPFNELMRPFDDRPTTSGSLQLVADLGAKAGTVFASLAERVAAVAEPGVRRVERVLAGDVALTAQATQPRAADEAVSVAEKPATNEAPAARPTLVAAFAPAEPRKVRVDPLKLLTEAALHEKSGAEHGAPKPALPRVGVASEVASSAFAGLEAGMRAVAAIVPTPTKPAVLSRPLNVSSLGQAEKSRVREWLQAAQSPSTATVADRSSTDRNAGRGARLTGSPTSVEARIDGAFVATR